MDVIKYFQGWGENSGGKVHRHKDSSSDARLRHKISALGGGVRKIPGTC